MNLDQNNMVMEQEHVQLAEPDSGLLFVNKNSKGNSIQRNDDASPAIRSVQQYNEIIV